MIDPFLYAGVPAIDCKRLKEIAETPGMHSIDMETTIAPAYQREICTIQITHENGDEAFAYVYPHGYEWLNFIFEKAPDSREWVAFNSTFEAECCVNNGVLLFPECAMIAAKVLRGSMEGDKKHRMGWSLKEVMQREFDKVRDKTIRDRDWREPPDAEAVEYGMEDTRDALALWQQRWQGMFDADPQQYAGYRLLMESMPGVVECNLHGLPFDPDAHLVLIKSLTEQMADQEFMLDLLCWGQIENHGSVQQVAAWMRKIMLAGRPQEQVDSPTVFSLLYQKYTGVHWPLTESGAMSLDRAAVETRLATLSKVAPDVAAYLLQRLQWSKIAKQKQAFGETLRKFVGDDGYARSSTRIHGAQTSRMSANSFNHQQMPAEPEFRALFKAKKKRKLVVADYGQIELRVGSIIAPDPVMQAVFGRGEDIHQASANAIKRLLTHDPTAVATVKERKASKGPTFAALYGAMAAAIAAASGLPLAEAEVLLNTWLSVYTGIRAYREQAFDRAKEAGGVRLVSGQFLRMAPDTRPAICINSPVQGSAASVLYRAMKLVHDSVLAARAQGHDIWLCAPIHDEIVLDTSAADAPLAADLLQAGMRQALIDLYPECVEMGMSNSADAVILDSWGDKDGPLSKPEPQAAIRAALLELSV
jgi:hypothetical protein